MRCRLEKECELIEFISKNRDYWRECYYDLRRKSDDWVEKWFDRLGELGFNGDSLEQRMISLESQYLSISNQTTKQNGEEI